MPKSPVIRIEVKSVLRTSGGYAVFLGNDAKVFVIHIDHSVGVAITMALRELPRPRPLTHDLIMHIFQATGIKLDRVVINNMEDGVFFARLLLSMENELYQRKIMELDARPSDSIALAVQARAPIFVSQNVWNGTEDMSEALRKLEEEALSDGEDDSSESGSDFPDLK
ncbi:MAG: bifunctional nuclease family protein [Verrucomicrobiales bacterium]|nr:bifunctional nuclease family protein [Verrucomicrobiales bacterium]